MHKRLRLSIALWAMLLPSVATAQRTADWRDSASRLGAAAHALRDSLFQGDSTTTEIARHGVLAIAASTDQRTAAADAFARVIAMHDRIFDGELPSTSGFRIVLRMEGKASSTFHGSGSAGTIVLAGLPDTGRSIRVQRVIAPGAIVTSLLDRLGELMIGSVPELAKWIEDPPPLSMDETDRRNQSMYQFVTATGAMQRRCVAGDLTACRFALDIEHAPASQQGAAFPKFMHADFLYLTLELGGAGAWRRLRDGARDHVGDGLAAAARMPLDSLVATWRAGLLARRPAVPVLAWPAAAVTLTWIAVIVGGAVGASRWV